MTTTLKLFLILAVLPMFSFAQVEEINPPNYIKTITFRGNTQESQLPIIRLGDPLILEFDVLNAEEDDYYYEIEHYNYDWTPSRLVKSEYLNGFDRQRIRNYENSFNTYQIYSHYYLQIPNPQTRGLLQSGNYLITIYNDYDEVVFTRKFMIYEELVNVGVVIKRSRDVQSIQEKQTVDFKIVSGGFRLNNPLETIKTVVVQNNNLNTAIKGLKPQYTLGNELIYRYLHETSFWAGNEFLFFENKDIRSANVGVQFIELEDIYNNYLFTDIIRAERPYTYNPDINGNFLVTALNVDRPDFEADYALMHFSLIHPPMLDGSKIYVYGSYNNYALEDENEMLWNEEARRYETSFRMKQGFYNYKYVKLDPSGKLDEGAISGNFWQTENNYKVLVYYRDLGARFDRLIGVGEGSSVDISN